MYNRALSAGEIQTIYNAGTTGKCLTPVYITSVNAAGNNANLSWLAQRGVTYRVQFKTDLTSGVWSNLPPDVTATNSIAIWTDSTSVNAGQRFYRVHLLQ